MAITKATSSVLADNAALNNLNAGASIAFTKPVTLSDNVTMTRASSPMFSVAETGTPNSNIKIGAIGVYPGIWLSQSTPSLTNYAFLFASGTVFNTPSSNSIYFRVGNTNVMTVSPNRGIAFGSTYYTTDPGLNNLIVEGTVGIGTASPTAGYTLDVVGAAKISGNILCNGSILYLNAQQALTQGTNSLTLGAATYFTTINYGNASTTFHNFTAGNVGIGTTTPNEKLTVVGNISASGTVIASNYNPAANVAAFLADPTSAKLAAAVTDETGSGSLVFGTSPTIVTPTISQINGGTAANDDLVLQGTTSATRTTSYVNIQPSGGNVGIGTSTPLALLHVEAGATGQVYVSSNAASVASFYLKNFNATGPGLFVESFYNYFQGSVRIGQTAAGAKLQVKSTAGQDPLNVVSSSDAPYFVINSTGSVGIGTATPSEKLTVSGNISATGNITCTGHLAAATKSFKIPHQTKAGYLQYGVVESNEHSVYVRGKTSDDTITLPDHWDWLVESDSVTVTLTPYGSHQPLYIISADNKKVVVGGAAGEYHYVVYGTRKDVEALVIETAE